MRRLATLLLAASILACSSFSVSDLAPGVTVEGITRIRLGMTEAEVVSLLGEPVQREVTPDGLTLTYSRKAPGYRAFPMLWVTLENKAVAQVYANRSVLWGAKKDVLYLLNKEFSTGWRAPNFEELFSPRK